MEKPKTKAKNTKVSVGPTSIDIHVPIVFISWSGETSRKAARALGDWIEQIAPQFKAFISDKDIPKGAAWFENLRDNLENAAYGIICVTPENLREPWVHFEAGALAMMYGKGRVSPFLLGVGPADLSGLPLSVYQATRYEKDDVATLIRELELVASQAPRTDEQIKRAVNVWWPELAENLDGLQEEAKQAAASAPKVAPPSESEIVKRLDAILLEVQAHKAPNLGSRADALATEIAWQSESPDHLSVTRGAPSRIEWAILERLRDGEPEPIAAFVDEKFLGSHFVRTSLQRLVNRGVLDCEDTPTGKSVRLSKLGRLLLGCSPDHP